MELVLVLPVTPGLRCCCCSFDGCGILRLAANSTVVTLKGLSMYFANTAGDLDLVGDLLRIVHLVHVLRSVECGDLYAAMFCCTTWPLHSCQTGTLPFKRGFMRCPVHLGAAGTGTKLVRQIQGDQRSFFWCCESR